MVRQTLFYNLPVNMILKQYFTSRLCGWISRLKFVTDINKTQPISINKIIWVIFLSFSYENGNNHMEDNAIICVLHARHLLSKL
jgi:hypothetical protein